MRFMGYGKNDKGELTISKKWYDRYIKLQDFTLCGAPRPYFLDSMTCPFTWFTVFCVLVFPFFFPLRSVASVLFLSYRGLEKILDVMGKLICDPLYKDYIKGLDDSQINAMFDWGDRNPNWYNRRSFSRAKVKRWGKRFKAFKKFHGDNWREKMKEAMARYEKEEGIKNTLLWEKIRKLEKIKDKNKAARKKDLEAHRMRIAKIVSATEFLFPYIAFGVGCLALYGLGYSGMFFYDWLIEIWTDKYTEILKNVFLFILLVMCNVLFVILFINLIKKCDMGFKVHPIFKTIGRFIGKPFIWLGSKVQSFGEYLGEIITILSELKKYCPPLKVDEE